MALLFADSFDSATDASALATKYSAWQIQSLTTARTGINAVLLDYPYGIKTKTLPASGGFIIGAAIYSTGYLGPVLLFRVCEGSTVHLTLYIDSTGHLVVRRGNGSGGTLLGTSTTTLSINSWYYIEFKGAIHDSTGSFTVHVDEATFGGLTGSSLDTRNGGTGIWDSVYIGNANTDATGGQQFRIDDLYICDDSGSLNNDFLGNTKITCLLPQTDAVGGAGSNQAFTPSTGTDHGALVDESGPNTTDYLSDSNAGDRETFNYPALSGITGVVRAVVSVPYLKKSDTGARTAGTTVRVSATNYDHPDSIVPTTSFAYHPQVWQTNPNTSAAWTVANIDGAEFGVKVVS